MRKKQPDGSLPKTVFLDSLLLVPEVKAGGNMRAIEFLGSLKSWSLFLLSVGKFGARL